MLISFIETQTKRDKQENGISLEVDKNNNREQYKNLF